MKKIKVNALTVALLGLICAGFTSARQNPCWFRPQFYKIGNMYFPAGVLGVTYDCSSSINICTWYRPNPVTQPNVYVPCQDGTYTVIPPSPLKAK